MHTSLLHENLPALPNSILLWAAAVCHLLVKHQGIFKTHLAGVIWLQPWRGQRGSNGRKLCNKHISFTIWHIRHPASPVSASKNSSSLFMLSTERDYADVMFPPSACARSPASLQTSQTAKQTHCKSTDMLRPERHMAVAKSSIC